ncbi:MAG: degV family protein [Chloroflexi bacterium]|nr:degV family protein [Chloroflexota bacterium]
MPEVAIVTDSTADFVGPSPASLGITVVPLTVNWGRDVLRDGVDISPEEFYLRLRTDLDIPKTAAPPLGIFEEVYRGLLAKHDAVISVHISSKLSGTQSVAATAARAVDAGRIHIVDSLHTSVTLGWLAQRAAEMAHAGETADATLWVIQSMIPRLRIVVTLDTLEYLRRGGRIGRAQAFLGGLLNVKPVLHVEGGEVHPLERVRTRAASLRRVAEIARGLGPLECLAVVHGDCENDARELRHQVAAPEDSSSVPITELGSVLATHTGPGVIGVGCLIAS